MKNYFAKKFHNRITKSSKIPQEQNAEERTQ